MDRARSGRAGVVLAILAACADAPAPPGPTPTDHDGDGAISRDDCDDRDPAVHPGAPEVCDGVDQDCDGSVDEEIATPTTWYGDADHDGHGTPYTTTTNCPPPVGMVASADDCDDTRGVVHPGAPEVCDGLDNNCDGDVDVAAIDGLVAFVDADDDGYGDPGRSDTACSVGAGWSGRAGDCDDADPATHAGALERCGGGDEDCDGTIDEDDAIDAVTWYVDADGDGWGDDTTATVACASPFEGGTTVAGDCAPDDPASSPDAVERCDDTGGVDEDCDGLVDPPCWSGSVACDAAGGCGIEGERDVARDATLVGDREDGFAGRVIAGAGDVDGDGRDDLLVGAPGAYAEESRVFLARGSLRGELALSSVAAAIGARPNPWASSVGTAGDVDGDGRADVLLGGLDDTTVLLVVDPLANGLLPASAVATYRGVVAGVGAGIVGPGDLDGDGALDLLFGNGHAGGPDPVAGCVVSAELRGDIDLASAGVVVTASSTSTFPGNQAVWAGDVDGDGADDVAFADYADGLAGEQAGAIALFHGGLAGTVSLAEADLILTGAAGDLLAMGLAGGADLTGDGAPDLLAGSWSAGRHGKVWVLPTSGAGVVAAPEVAVATFNPSSGTVGDPVDIVGDTDGDGMSDVLVVDAAGEIDRDDRRQVGWLFRGPLVGALGEGDAAAVLSVGVGDGGWRVDSARGVGDLNGDGFADLAIGNMHDGRAGAYTGVVWLLYGG